MASSQKRIGKELQECMTSPPTGMVIMLPSETDIHHWTVTLAGPPGTVYSGGTYTLAVNLPADYPFKAPQVTFATRIYHPNVTNDSVGSICLGMLKPENWKPASRVRAVLDAVRQLLVEPNPDDPLEPRIADEFKNNLREFEKNARSYVARYAQQQQPSQSQTQSAKK
ncbi:ubiquitin-conjugating enzyme [Daldinia caldariorum]|uniref:ubiquitin-conjugating enzyme n=1 Tax=Daldinia caldariorum TaxID=326644 RepID=UPI002007C42A|nr:ubiquitin-conjugating enzyme [Daldinia caldariorum]KAI1467694.1 ubiquitin-conjugating enzyme [Daldinia caldariorum]